MSEDNKQKLEEILKDPDVRSVDPTTGLTMDETRREGTYEEILPTPQQVEEVMLEKDKKVEVSPLDNHAAFCAMYYPRMLRYIEILNKKALARVIESAIKYPIEETDKKFQSQQERDLFNIINQLLTSKYIMILHSAGEEMQKQEELKKKEKSNGEVQENSDRVSSEG